jgi:hypothetical protein
MTIGWTNKNIRKGQKDKRRKGWSYVQDNGGKAIGEGTPLK